MHLAPKPQYSVSSMHLSVLYSAAITSDSEIRIDKQIFHVLKRDLNLQPPTPGKMIRKRNKFVNRYAISSQRIVVMYVAH
jgi:hypothetical protein